VLSEDLASKLSYAYQEEKTPALGEALAKYICKIPVREPDSGTEVVFIAHSLGCRVVMETLRNLVNTPVRVLGICLMAAAVPVSTVAPGGDLRSGAQLSDKVYILYSPADRVLHWAFRPGQFRAHLGTFPEAVGRFGNPFHRLYTVFDNVVNTALDHGDYYRGRGTDDPGPNRTRPTIARLFGRPQPSMLKDNYLVQWSPPRSAPEKENRLRENTITLGDFS
jgi:hypothetical protein